MNQSCKNLWEAIVELAEGKAQPEASHHIHECSECNAKFQGLVKLFSGLGLPQYEAPQELVTRAKLLMPHRGVQMGLIRTTLSLAGARSAHQDFQAVFGAEDTEVRVMYSRSGGDWDVMAKAPDASWILTRHSEQLALDSEGRFHFLTQSLDDSGFVLEGQEISFEIPSIAEVLRESGSDS